MSLFHPPAWFPPQLAFLWPLIWVQMLMLRAQTRAAYGRGVKYHWCIGANGRMYLYSIDWIPGQKTERAFLKPAAHSSGHLAAAFHERAFMPAYAGYCANPHDDRNAPAGLYGLNAPSVPLYLPLPET